MKKIFKYLLVLLLMFTVYSTATIDVDASNQTSIMIGGSVYDYTQDTLPYGGEYDASTDTITFKEDMILGTSDNPLNHIGFHCDTISNFVFEGKVEVYVFGLNNSNIVGITLDSVNNVTFKEDVYIQTSVSGLHLMNNTDDVALNIEGDLNIDMIGTGSGDLLSPVSLAIHTLGTTTINAKSTSEISLTSTYECLISNNLVINNGTYDLKGNTCINSLDLIFNNATIIFTADVGDYTSGLFMRGELLKLVNTDFNGYSTNAFIKCADLTFEVDDQSLFTVSAGNRVFRTNPSMFTVTDKIDSSLYIQSSTTDFMSDLITYTSFSDIDLDLSKLMIISSVNPNGDNNNDNQNNNTNTDNKDKVVQTSDNTNLTIIYSVISLSMLSILLLKRKQAN